MLEAPPLWSPWPRFTRENLADVDGLVVLHLDGLTWDFCLDTFASRHHVPRRPRVSPTIPGNLTRSHVRTRTKAHGHQHILRLLNTNVDGKRKVMYALTEIKGVGRRYSNIVCKKADVDLNKRCVVSESIGGIFSSQFTTTSAGELNSDELERLVTIIQNPTQFKIPTWFLNRQKDIVDGKNSQILSNGVDSKLRDDLERLKKIRAHRGLRHFWGLRVRGQHTKTTGTPIFCLIFLARILIRCFRIV